MGAAGRGAAVQRWLALRQHWTAQREAFHLALAALVGSCRLVNFLLYLATESGALDGGHDPATPIEVARCSRTRRGLPFRRWGAARRLILPMGLAPGAPGGFDQHAGSRGGRWTDVCRCAPPCENRLRPGEHRHGRSIGREGPSSSFRTWLEGRAIAAGPSGAWASFLACRAPPRGGHVGRLQRADQRGRVRGPDCARNFSMNLFAPLVCASVVAAVTSRSFFGIAPWVPGTGV